MVDVLPQAIFTCKRCGKPAAIFTYLPAGTSLEAGDYWHDKERLRREGFMGVSTHLSPGQDLAAVFEILKSGDYQAIVRATNPDLIGFHCWQCDLDYCQDCWDIGPPEFDEDLPGFYDCTQAVCPIGHAQIVDD